jgi:myo-inositol 2-dehydrogenase/D-chiro-inositol 1-dehydrogenase
MSTAAGFGKFAANGNFEDNLAFADRDKERTFIDSIVSGRRTTRLPPALRPR